MAQQRPEVGVGVIVENERREILIGRRVSSHAQKYSIPGGGLKLGETFEQCAIRELEEEHGIVVVRPKVIAITNNLETYRQDGVHFASVILVAHEFEGEPVIREPDKCAEIMWCDPQRVPQPHFEASRLAIECYLRGEFYRGISE